MVLMQYTHRFTSIAVALLSVAAPLSAQVRSRSSGDAAREPASSASSNGIADAETRRILGLTLSLSGNARDTLGVLVSSVVQRGPADEAGISEGNRIAELNGASLRVDGDAVGQEGAERSVTRVLMRQLRLLRPGEAVTLRVFAGGRPRVVRLPAAGAETVAQTASSEPRSASSDRSPSPERSPSSERPGSFERIAPSERPSPSQEAASGPTLATVMEAINRLQAQVNQLARAPQPATAEQSLDRGLPGLRVSAVDDDLAMYFGEGSEQGLLVLEAGQAWSPLRSGDVILTVDGEQVEAARLRSALESHRQAKLDVIRRKRRMTVTLAGGRE
jgi:S1-C subfamily serine protease